MTTVPNPPAAAPRNADVESDRPRVAGAVLGARERCILVVDDDPTFALLAAETLRQAGFPAVVAGSVEDARAAIRTTVPDLVLLDVELPDGNGFDLCRTLRAERPTADVPVVMVTGHNDTESIAAAYRAGAADFIHKPVLWAMLPHRIHFILRAIDDRRSLAESERRNQALLQALPDAIAIVDTDGVIASHLTGRDTQDSRPLTGSSIDDAYPPALAEAARDLLRRGANADAETHEFGLGDGPDRRWFEARLRPQADGSLLIVTRDTTERRRARARIEYLAFYDLLTKLPNRQLFVRTAARVLEGARRTGTAAALLYLDLDRFKRINDNLGHAVGDALLQNVARRLEQHVHRDAHDSGTVTDKNTVMQVARLSGDEFVVLVCGVGDDRETAAVAERIHASLAEPFDCAGHHLVVTPSIGIAVYPRDASDVDDLLVKADMAMYQAKDQGRAGHAFFGHSMAVRSLGRLEIEAELRRAIERHELTLHYQPKLDLGTGTIVGVEALLRWQHAERGWIPPDKFVPVAEETGLIVPIGEWVISEVCAQLRRWDAAGFATLSAAVNVSAQQFVRHDFVDSVLAIVAGAGLAPHKLELEITESLLLRNVADTTAGMRRFREHGIALSIDDFGTGYSSLGYLRQLPVSALKIDRSFVSDLPHSDDAATICAAIIAMARELKLKVVAEGVETCEQLAFLTTHHCDYAQGYLVSRPVPPQEIEQLLRAEGDPSSPMATRLRGGEPSPDADAPVPRREYA